MKLYHATTKENATRIFKDFAIKPQGFEECVFLADNETSAVLFLSVRGEKDVVVFEVDTNNLDIYKLEESFDHNRKFFRCKAYRYKAKISLNEVNSINLFNL